MKKENQALVEAASTLTRSLACDGLVLAADVIEDCAALRAIVGEQKVILVAQNEEAFQDACQASFAVLRYRDWTVRIETRTRLSSTTNAFHLQAELEAYEGDTCVFARDWDRTIPRDLV